jgi:hypothetical protein
MAARKMVIRRDGKRREGRERRKGSEGIEGMIRAGPWSP